MKRNNSYFKNQLFLHLIVLVLPLSHYTESAFPYEWFLSNMQLELLQFYFSTAIGWKRLCIDFCNFIPVPIDKCIYIYYHSAKLCNIYKVGTVEVHIYFLTSLLKYYKFQLYRFKSKVLCIFVIFFKPRKRD